MRQISLTSNTLKIIAAICMLIDHIGYIFMPQFTLLRIIGRLAFPLFAFMIAEGCRYTKNRLRYFSYMAMFGLLMQCVYFIFTKSMYMNVFITFSFSILLVYTLHARLEKYSRIVLFISAAASVYVINLYFKIDYGFWGCMLPVFASFYTKPEMHIRRIGVYALGLLFLSNAIGSIQFYCLLAILPLLCYNGKRGNYNLKYFFYIFYPVHLAVLYVIDILL